MRRKTTGTDPTKRFSARVENYIKYRPRYPEELLHFMKKTLKLTRSTIIADIGSGTGILSELLLKAKCRVYGIEPNKEMRESARIILQNISNFISINGTAESTTLKDNSVDTITAGQSFHWFNIPLAKKEFSRILKTGGHVVLVWNSRKTDSPFSKAYEELLNTYAIDYKDVKHRNISEGALNNFFGSNGLKKKIFENYQLFNFTGLKGRLLSSSYAPMEGHPNHIIMVKRLKHIFSRYQVKGTVTFAYDTEVYYGELS